MRALVTGSGGQLGRALVSSPPSGADVAGATRMDLDIGDTLAVRRFVADYRPGVIVNAAAFTDVDAAEGDPDAAWRVNATGVANLAEAAAEHRARLVHVSTDYVFGGSAEQPYKPADTPAPLSSYARSKLEGERVALDAPGGIVLRTSRVFALNGTNFVTTMLRLMADRSQISVVDDQIGSPTDANDLASVLWRLAMLGSAAGRWHWTGAGSCTFFEWAEAIRDGAIERGLLASRPNLDPVSGEEFGAAAKRPSYSVLDCSATSQLLGVQQLPWRSSLGTMLDEMASDSDPAS